MKRIDLDKDWMFYESEESNSFVFDQKKGISVDLPHDFIVGKPRSADAPGGPANGYFGNGQGVYKKNLEIPGEWKGKTVLMDVDGAYMNLEILVNNELVGMHPNGYIPYQADITHALRFDGRKNKLKLITQSRQPSTRWYSGGGLYRDVCLWVGNPVHVKPWDIFVTTPEITPEYAVVNVEAEFTGTDKEQQIEVEYSVLDENKKVVAKVDDSLKLCGKQKKICKLTVDNPHLWNLEDPYLYTYRITLKTEGTIQDVAEDTFGIRRIEADAENGFRLNGKKDEEEGSNFEVNLLQDNSVWNEVTKEFCEPLDIVGYNYLKDIYEESHEMFPKRVMLGTETHSFTIYDFWQKVENLPYVIGDCIWAAVDYMGEVGVGKVYWEKDQEEFSFMTPYPWRTSWQSDIDLTGEQRPQSVYREIMWGNREKSGIFTTHPKHFGEKFKGTDWHWYDVNDCWYFEECWLGKPVKVDIYGAGDEAEFILNGESQGRKKMDRLMASMDICYTPGTLEGIVYQDGKEISRCRLVTPGTPYRLVLIPEDTEVKADGKDLAYVRVILEDEEGNRLTHEEREIHVDVSGAGTFVAVGSGNPCTEDHITAKECHLYRGTAVIIMKSKTEGETKITVTADGVEKGSCIIKS